MRELTPLQAPSQMRTELREQKQLWIEREIGILIQTLLDFLTSVNEFIIKARLPLQLNVIGNLQDLVMFLKVEEKISGRTHLKAVLREKQSYVSSFKVKNIMSLICLKSISVFQA